MKERFLTADEVNSMRDLLRLLEGEKSNRSLGLSGSRRHLLASALRVAIAVADGGKPLDWWEPHSR